MTSPTNDNADVKTGVSLLGRIFGKVQQAPKPPAGLEDRLSYTDKAGSNGTDAAYYWQGDTPSLDDQYFPTVPQQDILLVHYDRPPADQNPQAWWDDRNIWAKQQRDKIEQQTGVPQEGSTSKPGEMGPDPRWTPPIVNRPTAFNNPNGYSFTRPYDQTSEHELNGVHFSLAENRRAYVLGGSVGRINTWNNSYRIDPVTNDATAIFVGDTLANNVDTTILYTQNPQQVAGSRSGRLM